MKNPEIKKVITNKGEKKVALKTSGKEKQGYTVAPLVSLSGKPLTSLIVWPSKGKKTFKINIPSNLFVSYRDKGSWIDNSVIEEYTRQIIKPYFRDKKPSNLRGLLLLDNHACHNIIASKLSNLNVDVLFFPPNCSSLLQPLDITTNLAIKRNYCDLWTDVHVNPSENRKLITIPHKKEDDISNETFMTWVSKSLKGVSKEIIVNGWNPLINGLKNEEVSQISMIADIDNDEARDNDMEDMIDEFDIDPNEKVEGEYAFIEEMLDFEIIEKDELKIKILL